VLNIGSNLFALIVIALILLVVFGIIDAARRPVQAFEHAGQSKTMWVALQAAGLLFLPVGGILTLTYLLSIRSKLATAT
jgi:hypothetical protein